MYDVVHVLCMYVEYLHFCLKMIAQLHEKICGAGGRVRIYLLIAEIGESYMSSLGWSCLKHSTKDLITLILKIFAFYLWFDKACIFAHRYMMKKR